MIIILQPISSLQQRVNIAMFLRDGMFSYVQYNNIQNPGFYWLVFSVLENGFSFYNDYNQYGQLNFYQKTYNWIAIG